MAWKKPRQKGPKIKRAQCIDFDKKTETYGFVTFDKKLKVAKRYRRTAGELEKEELDLLYADFANHWNALPLKARNRFIKYLTKESKKLHGK